LKLNGTHQLLVYTDDINILGGSVHTIKKYKEALVVVSKENGLDVNADKIKHMVKSQDQNAGRSHNINTDNSSFGRLKQFIYLGTSLTNQNSIQEEIKSRLKSGNDCYHSVKNLVPYSLLSKNIEMKIYRTEIFAAVLHWCETWSLTLREECRLRVFASRVLRRIFESKRDKVTGEWRKLHTEELNDLYTK
jgi:hypothetical protein